MNALPIDIIRNILTFRGTDAFEALHTELITGKRQTQKWLREICDKIVDADQNDEITHKEYLILNRIYNKYRGTITNTKSLKSANTLDN